MAVQCSNFFVRLLIPFPFVVLLSTPNNAALFVRYHVHLSFVCNFSFLVLFLSLFLYTPARRKCTIR